MLVYVILIYRFTIVKNKKKILIIVTIINAEQYVGEGRDE